MAGSKTDLDLIVVGASNAGLDLAGKAADSGLSNVAVLEATDRMPPPRAATRHHFQLHHDTPVTGIAGSADGVAVATATGELKARAVAIALTAPLSLTPGVPASIGERVHASIGPWAESGMDVLVVADGETGAQSAIDLVGLGASVVVAFEPNSLSRICETSRRVLSEYEVERRIAMLWHIQVAGIEDYGGFPMVFFDDRQTPDLQFDQVLYSLGDPEGGVEVAIDGAAGVLRILDVPPGSLTEQNGIAATSTTEAWSALRKTAFPELAAAPLRADAWVAGQDIGELRDQHYNATITAFDTAHSDLWVLRVRPDHGDVSHLPGQYTTLGLGYWEPRYDQADDDLADEKRRKLIRRSYSISSPIFDEHGYLVDPYEQDDLEFYIVRVPPSASRVPALTPRLALKHPGDRLFLGSKMAGRYTLAPVTDPACAVVFLASGTGEAPHNAMASQLLRRGHYGPIVSVVSVRHQHDLGYLDRHRSLQQRFDNYHYLPLVTRDRDQPKRYVQDVIADGTLAEVTGGLDATTSHVFLCGNPLMLGAPEWEDGRPVFPETAGAIQQLHELGFSLDRRGHVGNVHFEAFW